MIIQSHDQNCDYDLAFCRITCVIIYESIADYLAYSPSSPAFRYIESEMRSEGSLKITDDDREGAPLLVFPFLQDENAIEEFLRKVVNRDKFFTRKYELFKNRGSFTDHIKGFAKVLQAGEHPLFDAFFIPIDEMGIDNKGYYFF